MIVEIPAEIVGFDGAEPVVMSLDRNRSLPLAAKTVEADFGNRSCEGRVKFGGRLPRLAAGCIVARPRMLRQRRLPNAVGTATSYSR